MNIYHEQSKNTFKTWLLMVVFLVVIIAIGFVFAEANNSPGILYFAIIFSLFMNFFSYWYSDKVVLSMYRAQPVTHDQAPELWNVVENLAMEASHSGLVRTLGKRVWGNPPRVRISPPPQKKNSHKDGLFFLFTN
jgi:Zn-dependent protease with chaperone function